MLHLFKHIMQSQFQNIKDINILIQNLALFPMENKGVYGAKFLGLRPKNFATQSRHIGGQKVPFSQHWGEGGQAHQSP